MNGTLRRLSLIAVAGFASLAAAACASNQHGARPVDDARQSDASADAQAPDPETGLRPGECWTHEDCMRSGDGVNTMCSLSHVGREPPRRPDQCTSDADCSGPRQRCIYVINHRRCTAPGRCEPCCKP